MLLTSVPSRVAHHIDIYSPLMPSEFRHRNNIVHSYGLNLREVDSYTGNRSGCKCPVCGETYGTLEQLWKHIKYNQLIERYSDQTDDMPDTHLALGDESSYKQKHTIPTYAHLQNFWNENQMEVIAVVEGIDPLASGTFQALQSYQKEDVVFGNVSFAKCFTDGNVVDFDLFHEVVCLDDNYDTDDNHDNDDQCKDKSYPNRYCCTPMQSTQNGRNDVNLFNDYDDAMMKTNFPKIPFGEDDTKIIVGHVEDYENKLVNETSSNDGKKINSSSGQLIQIKDKVLSENRNGGSHDKDKNDIEIAKYVANAIDNNIPVESI